MGQLRGQWHLLVFSSWGLAWGAAPLTSSGCHWSTRHPQAKITLCAKGKPLWILSGNAPSVSVSLLGAQIGERGKESPGICPISRPIRGRRLVAARRAPAAGTGHSLLARGRVSLPAGSGRSQGN